MILESIITCPHCAIAKAEEAAMGHYLGEEGIGVEVRRHHRLI
jgi:hypothetical protein